MSSSCLLAEAVGVEPTVLPWLAEIAAPRWEGTPADVVEQAFAESRHRPLDEQWDGLPGGESFRAFHVRVTTGLRAMLDDEGAVQTADDPPLWKMTEPHRRLVIVAHSGTNATALGHLLGIPPVPWEWERFVTLHASVSQVEPIAIGGGHAFSLSRLSAVDHLPETDRTR
jgi:broad specificity phosphatase PhoE